MKNRNLCGVFSAVLMMAGVWLILSSLQTQRGLISFVHEQNQFYSDSMARADSLDYPMNETTALKAGLILNSALDVAFFVFWASLGILYIGLWFLGNGIFYLVAAYKNRPTWQERIRALEQNQKTMVGQQDRILAVIEKKLRLDAIKRSEQSRDSHGRFRKGGRR